MVSIYAYTSIETGRAYIGQTSGKINKRAREHRAMCKANAHHSRKLQREWWAFGSDGFVIRALEELSAEAPVKDRLAAELKWIQEYKARGLLLNANEQGFGLSPESIRKGIEASRRATGKRWTPETNEKRRSAQLGIAKNHGAKISATKRAKREAEMR